MSREVIYQPSEWGKEFHSLGIEEVLGAGAAGPGKSLVLLMDPLEQIQTEHRRCVDKEHPHFLHWGMSTGWALHLRRTRPMLEQTLQRAKRMFPRIDPRVKFDSERYTFHFASGYCYQFGHCRDTDDWEQYLSNQYTWIGFDELVQFEQEQYDQIVTRLRSSDPVLQKMQKVRSVSNPLMNREKGAGNFTVRDPFWVRRRFVDRARKGRVIFKRKLVDPRSGENLGWHRWMYLPATIDDNPDKAFVADYKKRLLNAPMHIQQAQLYGDWYVTMGSYFGDVWNERLNVCKPFAIPDDWARFRSMDWGFKTPGCIHWWAMDPDDNLFCEKEFTFQGQIDADVARRVQQIEENLGLWDGVARRSRITGPADTNLWEQRGGSALSSAEVFDRFGVPWLPAQKNTKTSNRAANAQRIYKRLGDHEGGSTTPGLVIFDTCTKLLETLPSVQMTPGDPEMPMDSDEDHWFDSASYAVSYASRGSRAVGRPADEKDEWDEEDERKPQQSRGRYGYGNAIL